jgi:hypothetical protein
MRRLDEHEEMMERIEAKLDVLMSRMVEKDKAKQARPFIDYIKDPERAPEILAQLHRWIDNNRKSKALVYLKAATEARVLEQPPYPAAAAEFPSRLGSESLYYAYLGEPNSFTERAQAKIREAAEVLNKIAHD